MKLLVFIRDIIPLWLGFFKIKNPNHRGMIYLKNTKIRYLTKYKSKVEG